MERDVERLAREVRSLTGDRPPLQGESSPGNAWDDYLQAIDSARGLGAVQSGKWESHVRGFILLPLREEALQADAALGLAVDRMRAGAGRGYFRNPRDVGDPERKRVSFEEGAGVVYLSFCRARRLEEEGRRGEAAACLLDAALFARDVANLSGVHDPTGFELLGHVLKQIGELLCSRALAGEEVDVLRRGLDILELNFPSLDRVFSEHLLKLGLDCLSPEWPGKDWEPEARSFLRPGWRHAFSERLLRSDAFSRFQECCGRWIGSENLSWGEVRTLQRELIEAGEAEPNVYARVHLRNSYHLLDLFRWVRAQLRLARAAAHFRGTGDLSTWGDPFGSSLTSARSPETLRLWSVGPDGVDEGGRFDSNCRFWWNQKEGDLGLEIPVIPR